MIEVSEISKSYQMGDLPLTVLKGVSLKIEQGDYVAIMGPSGSGKSTLMHILGLLDTPDSGSFKIFNKEVSHLSEDELCLLRKKTMGFIFQQFHLLPRTSAFENVIMPLLYTSRKKEDEQRAREYLKRVGLDDRMDHRPNELSGGQQQRVAIARSLINQPQIILADEPTGNLDSASEKEVIQILKQLNGQGMTVIMVTHEEEIGRQAKRIIRMRDGHITSDERLAPVGGKGQSGASTSAFQENPYGLKDLFLYARQGILALLGNKVRSGLSMLGVMVGVAAVIAMLALGKGAQNSIEAQLTSLGSNLLVLKTGGGVRIKGITNEEGAEGRSNSVTRLTLTDSQSIQELLPTVKRTTSIVTGKVQSAFLNKNWPTQLFGTTPLYADMHAQTPDVGRFFTDEENSKRSRVAVIGKSVYKELFGGKNPIGEFIKINRVNFQVIGVLPSKGADGWKDQDDVIMVPLFTAMYRILGKNHVDTIEIEVTKAEEMANTEDGILNLMKKRHKVPASQTNSFQIRNMADLQEALSESGQTMTYLLASIAAISLMVGGIGIMNIMLISVTERTKEIGLRKSVGAKSRDILAQFLVESVVVSGVGGLMGILLGQLITFTMSNWFGWATSTSLQATTLAILFSCTIGIVFGIWPAKQASLLNPITALRHE